MKQDKLEKFIIDNRDGFDVFEPGEEIWDRIQKPAPKVIKLNWQTIAIRVAAVMVIFVASYFFHDLMQKDNNNNIAVVDEESMEESNEQVQMLMEAEFYYTSQINVAKDEIFVLSGNDKSLLEEINFDMVELDEILEELKDDLNDDSDNEEVIEAMVQNYRIKLQVLEEILTQLKKSKEQEENENHEI